MKVQSAVEPDPIEITNLGKRCRVRMRENIEQIIRDDEQLYQYDEVVFEIDCRLNLRKDIEQNFAIYFQYGEQYMENQRIEQEKQREIDRLIREKELVEEQLNLALASAEIYERMEQTTLENSLAIAEIYEMITGGGV